MEFLRRIFEKSFPFFAILAPGFYVANGFIELGRLSYLNAPTDFIQLTSFGFSSLISNAPVLIVMLMVNAFIWGGAKYLSGPSRYGQYFLSLSFFCGLASYYSLTLVYQALFGSVFVAGLAYAAYRKSDLAASATPVAMPSLKRCRIGMGTQISIGKSFC